MFQCVTHIGNKVSRNLFNEKRNLARKVFTFFINCGKGFYVIGFFVEFAEGFDAFFGEFLRGIDIVINGGRVAVSRESFNFERGVYEGVTSCESVPLRTCKNPVVTNGQGEDFYRFSELFGGSFHRGEGAVFFIRFLLRFFNDKPTFKMVDCSFFLKKKFRLFRCFNRVKIIHKNTSCVN